MKLDHNVCNFLEVSNPQNKSITSSSTIITGPKRPLLNSPKDDIPMDSIIESGRKSVRTSHQRRSIPINNTSIYSKGKINEHLIYRHFEDELIMICKSLHLNNIIYS